MRSHLGANSHGDVTLGSDHGHRRRTNLALLVLVPLAVLTGLWSNTIGTDWLIDPTTVHAVIAIAIAVLSLWKSLVVRRGLRKWKRSTWTSVLLLGLILMALITGSHQLSPFDQSGVPVTSWLDDRVQHLGADLDTYPHVEPSDVPWWVQLPFPAT